MPEAVINLDWFECMLTGHIGPELDFPTSYKIPDLNARLHLRNYGTTHFQHVYDVILDGREFGTLLARPREGNKLQPDFLQFQAKNHVLYEIGFIEDLQSLLKATGWKWRNPIRIDIAIDGGRFMESMQQVISGKLDRVGQQTCNVHFSPKMKITGFDLGKRDSDKWATCYYKKAELAKSYKHYIEDYWKRSELDDQENPQRLELKMRKKACLAIDQFTWWMLDQPSYLASCMRTQLVKMWQFTKPNENTNITRRKRFDFIQWDALNAHLLDKLEAVPPSEEYRLRMAVKSLYMIHLVTGETVYRQMALEISSIIRHVGWFNLMQERWEKELEGRLGDPSKADTIYKHLSRFVTYDKDQQLSMIKEAPEQFVELGAVAGASWFRA